MITLSKHIGANYTTNDLQYFETERFDKIADRAYITIFDINGCFENVWFELKLNDKHMKFDDEITMEFCREHFGHLRFGISNGEQATRNHAMRDNL